MTVEELDLARAKDMCPIIGEGTSCLQGRRDRDPCNKDNCMSVRAARAIRVGDEARGLRVVPVEATEVMLHRGCLLLPHNDQTLLRWAEEPATKDVAMEDMAASWRAMLAASPFAPEPEEKG